MMLISHPSPSNESSSSLGITEAPVMVRGDISNFMISNGNRTDWSPIQSVIIRVITKSDDRAAGVRFVYLEYDYRLNWTTRCPIIN